MIHNSHNSHKIRSSLSDLYDCVCVCCNATDSAADDRLDWPCQGNEDDGLLEQAKRDVLRKQSELQIAESTLKRLTKNKPA